MNDTTQTTPDQAPVAQVTPYQLMDTLGKVLFAHIEQLVERKVLEIFENHATLALINTKMEERIEEIVDSAIHEHESDNEHLTNDDVVDMIGTHINHYDYSDVIRRSVEEILSDGDYVTEDRVVDIVTDEVDFEEKVKEVLRNL